MPPPHAEAARHQYRGFVDAVNGADFKRYDEDRAAAKRAQRARVAAMSVAEFNAFAADQAERQERRLVAEALREEVADANPNHAEFIRDHPLEWYADGDFDNIMDEWGDGFVDPYGGEGGGEEWVGEETRSTGQSGVCEGVISCVSPLCPRCCALLACVTLCPRL